MNMAKPLRAFSFFSFFASFLNIWNNYLRVSVCQSVVLEPLFNVGLYIESHSCE